MAIPLAKLMEDISRSVQNSNFLLEQMSAEMYLQTGYQKTNISGKVGEEKGELLVPVTYSLRLSEAGQEKDLKVPATALMHHSTMQLEQVDVSLRFTVTGHTDEQGVMVEVKPKVLENSEKISEMKLRYQRDSSSEGVSRLETHHYQNL